MKRLLIILSLFLSINLLAVSFTLRNNSLKSIPLKIPGVMNPNLSPMSNSGVGLKVGQKIFCQIEGKKVLLLTVTEDLKDQTLKVDELIREKRKELEVAKKKSVFLFPHHSQLTDMYCAAATKQHVFHCKAPHPEWHFS